MSGEEATAMDVEETKETDPEKIAAQEAEDAEMLAMEAEWASMTDDEIEQRTRLITHEISELQRELQRQNHESNQKTEDIKNNQDKIKLNKQLPYLVGNIVEILDVQPDDEEEEDGANTDVDAQREGKCAVLKTSTRQTIFLPVIGLVDHKELQPAVHAMRPLCSVLTVAFLLGPSWCEQG
jgi:ATP-dependent 26S proteasome regulatory subunit